MLKEVRATFVRNATCFEPPQWRVCSHFTIAELVVVFFFLETSTRRQHG